MYPQILNHIKKYVQLEAHEEQLLCETLQVIRLKKKQYLLEPGKHCQGNYFVLKGCLRQYFVNTKLNEQIIQFGLENWWITDQDSLLSKQPSNCFIQALEESEVLLLTEKSRLMLFERIPKLQAYFLAMMQKAFVASQRRIGFIFNMNDEERYRHFAKLFPDFLQRVPQYMLASYLGFTPQFMSRLRAKKI
ncbi:Crp/Fnr family transcriptional regulator [Mucilaginibacter agri]|uniref:Cyclic nucleotide-binding domain-containing protein n=1 Tax=Mucilaginibacter agri TaxID=2695265 RepID=A0A966DTU9_9SPHI|nr:Crp/Fnr family transcriptional regulator [Mucilaginibacter agri]NCD69727.1 cyclic nucleotide-binding domain-containing protein [Mucilaginibacter agri]